MRISDWSSDVCSSDLAVEQHRLVPFAYYGIADGTDYRNVSRRRGRGYASGELSELVPGDHKLARRIPDNTLRPVTDPETVWAPAVWFSVTHACFMAVQFKAGSALRWERV